MNDLLTVGAIARGEVACAAGRDLLAATGADAFRDPCPNAAGGVVIVASDICIPLCEQHRDIVVAMAKKFEDAMITMREDTADG